MVEKVAQIVQRKQMKLCTSNKKMLISLTVYFDKELVIVGKREIECLIWNISQFSVTKNKSAEIQLSGVLPWKL